jgi:hypothetical protein
MNRQCNFSATAVQNRRRVHGSRPATARAGQHAERPAERRRAHGGCEPSLGLMSARLQRAYGAPGAVSGESAGRLLALDRPPYAGRLRGHRADGGRCGTSGRRVPRPVMARKRYAGNHATPVDLEPPLNFRREAADSEAGETSDRECPMTELSGQKEWTSDLWELSDPEFFAQWAAVRHRLFCVPKGRPEHCEIKCLYDAVAAEYRRRIVGALKS